MKGLSIELPYAFGRHAAILGSIRSDIFTHIDAGNAKSGDFIESASARIIAGDAQFYLADTQVF